MLVLSGCDGRAAPSCSHLQHADQDASVQETGCRRPSEEPSPHRQATHGMRHSGRIDDNMCCTSGVTPEVECFAGGGPTVGVSLEKCHNESARILGDGVPRRPLEVQVRV